jgi:hypothetical protein
LESSEPFTDLPVGSSQKRSIEEHYSESVEKYEKYKV